MKALAELVFVVEIVMQTKIAAQAAERLPGSLDQIDQIETWSSIQTILIAAGNVSKILWPPRPKSKERGARLRELLRVSDNNPLSERSFRNHFEHYDERIEDWFEAAGSATYADPRIDPFRSPISEGLSCCHRAYNPATMELTFRGEAMNLAVVLEALNEIREECRFHALA